MRFFRNLLVASVILLLTAPTADAAGFDAALIIQGGNESGIANTAALAKRTLLRQKLVPEKNLFESPAIALPPGEAAREKVNEQLSDRLSRLARATRAPNSKVLLYYIGHGDKDVLQFTKGEKGQLQLEWTFENLFKILRESFAGQDVMLVLDACYSGSAAKFLRPSDRITLVTASDAENMTRHFPLPDEDGNLKNFWLFSHRFFSLVNKANENAKILGPANRGDPLNSVMGVVGVMHDMPSLGKPGPEKIVPLLNLGVGLTPASNPKVHTGAEHAVRFELFPAN